MPEYCYVCLACNHGESQIRPMSQHADRPACPKCGAPMDRDLAAEGAKTLSPFPIHYSWQHGRKLSSWDDYHRANREQKLVDLGGQPEHLVKPPPKATSYAGKKIAE